MDEIENYSESIHEQSNEHAHHILNEGGGKERWIMFVALSTAIIAVLAAVSGLLAGDHSDDAMLDQMRASDQWAYYQAKGIKSDILKSSNNMLIAIGKAPDTADVNKIQKYKQDQQQTMTKAKDFEDQSDTHLVKHDKLARGVTLFQIAIAIGAISIITKRKALWFASLGFASIGIIFFIAGIFF
jgi:hypothetical protein